MSKEENKVIFQDLNFECTSCASCFCEESQWVTGLLESMTAICPDCGSELLIGKEEQNRLADFMNKKGRFGKAIFAFMLPYTIGGLIVSLYFGGLGFILYMPTGFVIAALLKMILDNRAVVSIRLDKA